MDFNCSDKIFLYFEKQKFCKTFFRFYLKNKFLFFKKYEFQFVLRLDCFKKKTNNNNSSSNDDDDDDYLSTKFNGKLKLIKKKEKKNDDNNYCYELRVCHSIEYDYNNIEEENKEEKKSILIKNLCASKVFKIVYFFIKIDKNFVFRVAFRRDEITKITTCNIECEEKINYNVFEKLAKDLMQKILSSSSSSYNDIIKNIDDNHRHSSNSSRSNSSNKFIENIFNFMKNDTLLRRRQ